MKRRRETNLIRVSNSGTRSKPRKIETARVNSKTLYFFAVGYGDYKDPAVSPLSYPQSDALAWCNFLTSQAQGMGYDRVVDLSGGCQHLNGQDLAALIADLPDIVTADDTAVGFLSGHGIRSDTGDFFCYPTRRSLASSVARR